MCILGSITDTMSNWGSTNNPDPTVMADGTRIINSFFGTLTGALFYTLFAGLALTTAFDLLYIFVPFTRQFLRGSNSSKSGNNLSQTTSLDHFNSQSTETKAKIQLVSKRLIDKADSGLACKSLLIWYSKDRAITLVLFTVVTLLLMSSVFTDFGLNVGDYILNILGF